MTNRHYIWGASNYDMDKVSQLTAFYARDSKSGHPSSVDEAWYWSKHILRCEWLCIMSIACLFGGDVVLLIVHMNQWTTSPWGKILWNSTHRKWMLLSNVLVQCVWISVEPQNTRRFYEVVWLTLACASQSTSENPWQRPKSLESFQPLLYLTTT